MLKIERANLEPTESAIQVSPVALVRAGGTPVARRASGRRNNCRIFIIFALLLGLLIFFGNVHVQPTMPENIQPAGVKTQVTPEIVAMDVDISEERQANIEHSLKMFDDMNKKHESMIHTFDMEPSTYTLFDPVYEGRGTEKIKDTSKCYGFSDFEHAFDKFVLSRFSEEERRYVPSQDFVFPLCLRTKGEYHFGLELLFHDPIPKGLYFEYTRNMMRTFLMLSESTRREQAEEDSSHKIE